MAAKTGPIEFLRQTKVELARVNWPTRQETVRLATLVVIVTLITAAYLGILDAAFTKLMADIVNK